jgi:hypothetical protein
MATGALQRDAVRREVLAVAFQTFGQIGTEKVAARNGLVDRVTRQTGGIAGFVVLNGVGAMTEAHVRKVIPCQSNRLDHESISDIGIVRIRHVVTAGAAANLELVFDFILRTLLRTGERRTAAGNLLDLLIGQSTTLNADRNRTGINRLAGKIIPDQ